MDATKEFKRWHVNTEEANQLAGWLRRNGIESNADLVESLIEERDAYLDEVQRTNENEARIMTDLLATREERDQLRAELDRLRAAILEYQQAPAAMEASADREIGYYHRKIKEQQEELDRLRSAPVAVEVPELTERDEALLRCVERALDKSPSMFAGYMGDGMMAWEASIALDSAIRAGRAIPSDRLLKDGHVQVPETDVAMIRRCLDECAWDDILQPIVDWTDRMIDALRSQRAAEGRKGVNDAC